VTPQPDPLMPLSPLQRQLVEVQLHLAQAGDASRRQLEIARRRANRLASLLGAVAAVLALYDLVLLAGMGRT